MYSFFSLDSLIARVFELSNLGPWSAGSLSSPDLLRSYFRNCQLAEIASFFNLKLRTVPERGFRLGTNLLLFCTFAL